MSSPILTETVITTLETAYSLAGTDGQWVESILSAARPDLDRGFGLYAATGRIENGHLMPKPPMLSVGLAPDCGRHASGLHRTFPCPILDAFAPRAVVCGGLDEAWPRKLEAAGLYRNGMAPARVVDAFLVFAQDGEGGAIKIVAPSPEPVVSHPRVRSLWGKVALHMAAALRLRRKVAAQEPISAILDVNGTVHHAVGEVGEDTDLRTRLLQAVKDAQMARGALRHEPERALELWSALLAGRFSSVDRWEADGRRYLLIYRNDPQLPDPRALGSVERAVAELIALGASTKEAAYAMGISSACASKALARSLTKLGLHHRGELTAFVSGKAQNVSVHLGEAQLDVLVTSDEANPTQLEKLTEAERDVVNAALRGLSNSDIGKTRGTSSRTIAKQVRSVFEKLGVNSRGELRARLLCETQQRPRTS